MNKTVLLVSHDKKTIAQISRWLKELPDEVVLETATSLDELNSKYLVGANSDRTDATAEVKTILRALVFDVAMFGTSDPIEYISQTRATLQNSPFCSSENPLKVMILSFDNAALPLRTFVHEDIDDLQMKPLDHQLFLQKVGMMVADKGNTEGSFLFKQKAKFTVEMAKDVRLVKLSEFGLVISNPSPLAPGVFAHLYSSVFGQKGKSSVWGRVFNTRRDPKVPGNYLCFFSFFGMQPDQLMNYRRFLRDRRKELRYFKTGYDRNRIPGAVRHVAVIERNEASASLIAEALSANFLNLKTYSYPSYAQFLKAVSGSAISTAPEPKQLSEGEVATTPFNGSEVTFLIRHESAVLAKTEPPINVDSRFCGVALIALVETTKWLDFLLPSDKNEWDEFLLTMQRGYRAQAILCFRNITGEYHSLHFSGEPAKSSDSDGTRLLRLDIREMSQEELVLENDRRRRDQVVFPHIDAIYIDANSIREFKPWYDGVKEILRKSNLLVGEKLPVCLLVEEKSKIIPSNFRLAGVTDFVYKPVDRRFLIAKAPILVTDLVPSSDNVDLSFTPVDLPIKIAKEVELNEMAEFGFQVKSNIPLRENIFLRFFSPLFLDESGEGVLGRCTACAPDPNQKDTYGCFFTFFGVSDSQLKHIRNWIREDYVSKKDEAG